MVWKVSAHKTITTLKYYLLFGVCANVYQCVYIYVCVNNEAKAKANDAIPQDNYIAILIRRIGIHSIV